MKIDLDAVTIKEPEGVRPAAERLQAIISGVSDFRLAICHNIALRQPMVDADGHVLATSVFGWSESDPWLTLPKLALESPLPTACRYESEPFWCNSEGFHTRTPNPLLAAIDLTNFQKRSHAAAAIIIPVHLPFGQIGAAGLDLADRGRTDLSSEFAALADMFGLLCRTFITGYVWAMSSRERVPVGTILSKREVQCLRWAAIGKTDPEIAMILECSPATIRFHLRNARSKLDSVNRSQTVFKAGQLGYIGLNS